MSPAAVSATVGTSGVGGGIIFLLAKRGSPPGVVALRARSEGFGYAFPHPGSRALRRRANVRAAAGKLPGRIDPDITRRRAHHTDEFALRPHLFASHAHPRRDLSDFRHRPPPSSLYAHPDREHRPRWQTARFPHHPPPRLPSPRPRIVPGFPAAPPVAAAVPASVQGLRPARQSCSAA